MYVNYCILYVRMTQESIHALGPKVFFHEQFSLGGYSCVILGNTSMKYEGGGKVEKYEERTGVTLEGQLYPCSCLRAHIGDVLWERDIEY